MTISDVVEWGVIDGRTITFPMVVRAANTATLLFTVPAPAARALLPGEAFEIVETAPGEAQLIVALCDYRENPWGDYDEINLGFLARPKGAGDEAVGSFVYRMPVNQAFTCEAGNKVMGFPKTVEDITVDYTALEVTFRLSSGGVMALTVTLPRVVADDPPARIEAISYSYLDGRPYATALEMDLGSGIVADPARVSIELGGGPIADELRSLGLPAVPDLATWGEGLSATFHLGRPLG